MCECEEYPLLRTINRVLRKYPGPHNSCFLEKTFKKPTDVTTQKPQSQRPSSTSMTPTTRRTTTKATPVNEGEDYDVNDNYPDSDDEPNACSGSRAFATHSSDCHKYFVCNHGNAIEMR